MRLQALHGSGIPGGFAVRHVGRYMLAFAQLPGQTRCRFNGFSFVGVAIKATLARAVVGDGLGDSRMGFVGFLGVIGGDSFAA